MEIRAGKLLPFRRKACPAPLEPMPRSSAFFVRMAEITPPGFPLARGSRTTARTVEMATRPSGIRTHTYQGRRGTVGEGRDDEVRS